MSGTFSIEKNDYYIVIHLTGDLDYKSGKLFEVELEGIFSELDKQVIVNCEQVSLIPKDWLRSLLKIHLNLKKDKKFLILIHVNPSLMVHLKKEGIDMTFKIFKDLKESLSDSGVNKKLTLNTEFMDPFLLATVHVLKIQAQIESKPGKVHVKKNIEAMSGDISGIIGLVSDSFNGSVVISFPESTFLKIISNMLGEEFTKVSQEIIDGASELTNMIFGQAKIVLNEKGYGIKTAIPNVITGKNHSLSAYTKEAVIVVPFESTAGNFFIEICLNT